MLEESVELLRRQLQLRGGILREEDAVPSCRERLGSVHSPELEEQTFERETYALVCCLLL